MTAPAVVLPPLEGQKARRLRRSGSCRHFALKVLWVSSTGCPLNPTENAESRLAGPSLLDMATSASSPARVPSPSN